MASQSARVVRYGKESAELELSKDIAERAGFKEGDALSVFAPAGNVVLLAREASGRRGYFVGSLETFSVSEIFGFVSSAIRSGTLVLQGPAERRRILFQDGQVLFAASTDLSERLGPVLWRKGMLTQEQLAECEPKVNATTKLGVVLVNAGLLTPAQLFRGVQLQMKEIVLNAFLETEGEFAFIEGETGELNTVKLAERTRDLVLEGLGRCERMELVRGMFDPAAPPRRTGKPGAPQGLEQSAVFALVDGTRGLRDLVRMSRLGEFAATSALADLVRAGLVAASPRPRPAARPASASKSAAGPMQLYAAAIARIAQAMDAGGGLDRLDTFFADQTDARRALFDGVRKPGPFALDFDRLTANAETLKRGPMGRALALEALDGFVSFALFDARNVLPAGKAVDLAREIQRLLTGK